VNVSLDDRRNVRSLQRYISNVGISGASLRNQGAPGVIVAARKFVAALDLTVLRDIAVADYPAWLERKTRSLARRLPAPAKKWGVARKAISRAGGLSAVRLRPSLPHAGTLVRRSRRRLRQDDGSGSACRDGTGRQFRPRWCSSEVRSGSAPGASW
jgi:hypothetical protein